MNSPYLLIACILAVTHCTDTFLPLGYYEGYRGIGFGGLVHPYVGVHPYVTAYPFYDHPYGLYGHYYRPRTSSRNFAQHFDKEDGHLTDTSDFSGSPVLLSLTITRELNTS